MQVRIIWWGWKNNGDYFVSRFLLELQGEWMHSPKCRNVCSPLFLTCEEVARSLLGSDPELEAVVSVQACSSLSSLLARVCCSVNWEVLSWLWASEMEQRWRGSTGTAELRSEALVLPCFSQYYSVSLNGTRFSWVGFAGVSSVRYLAQLLGWWAASDSHLYLPELWFPSPKNVTPKIATFNSLTILLSLNEHLWIFLIQKQKGGFWIYSFPCVESV